MSSSDKMKTDSKAGTGGKQSSAALPETSQTGLTESEVASLVEQGQVNVTNDESSRTWAQIIRSNVFTLFNAIFAVCTVIVLITGQWKDATFSLVIVINSLIGIVTEMRMKKTLDGLSVLVESDYVVRRGGKNVSVGREDIVAGDLLWIRSGEQIPADTSVIESYGLETDESVLTGESITVKKQPGDKALSGSVAVSGTALSRVESVGENSYMSKLTAEAKVYKKTVSDLNKGINKILKAMTFVIIPLGILLVITQFNTVGGFKTAMEQGTWRHAVSGSVAGITGMIPEGLVLLTSLNFAVAAMKLAKQKTLVQEMEAVETLARVDCLNCDKTGTITDGRISLDSLVPLDSKISLGNAAQALYDVCDEGTPNATGEAILTGLKSGKYAVLPSECEFDSNLFNAEKSGEKNISIGSGSQIKNRIPFSSARKWSAIETPDGKAWYFGAPEVLMSAMNKEYAKAREIVSRLADSGVRVVMLAAGSSAENIETLDPSMRPAALAVCSEHVREDAAKTLAWFNKQQVRCRIISGDNPRTVAAIAHKVGLTGERKPNYADARDLPEDIDSLAEAIENIDVLGRVLPEQKKAIVQALHKKSHTVAMTGDGVNDALAIKEADLGIAMGNAASATKAVAQIVLVDSKFSHLPDVVARGRQVMANMERVAGLFLVKTFYSALISLGVILMSVPMPYLPRHITYVGGLTIGTPAFFLALAPNTRRYIPGFLKRVVRFAAPSGTAIAVAVLTSAAVLPKIFSWNLSDSNDLFSLRSTISIILFAMSIFVLARVATPLASWRGILVLAFAAAGIIGMHIPFVADYFALKAPEGELLKAVLIAIGMSAVIFAVIVMLLSFAIDSFAKKQENK